MWIRSRIRIRIRNTENDDDCISDGRLVVSGRRGVEGVAAGAEPGRSNPRTAAEAARRRSSRFKSRLSSLSSLCSACAPCWSFSTSSLTN